MYFANHARVTFAGFQLSPEGCQIDLSITEAISNFPTPANHTDLRFFCGLVKLPDSCKRYWQIHHSLTIDDDFIVYGCWLLIPSQMRRQVLQQLHKVHQGATHTKQ